jgi:hypothetical protein
MIAREKSRYKKNWHHTLRHINSRKEVHEMEAIFGYNGLDAIRVYQIIVCITIEKSNHIKPILVSAVSGYPVGEV